jgi:hypothetical protein
MVGMNAPARRLAFMFRDFGANYVSTEGTALFQAAINWSLGLDGGLTAPTITTQPANSTTTEGQVATFSVSATGTPSPTYQWRKNGVTISGATSDSYTISVTALVDNGAVFSVVATNVAGSATSNNATLTVNSPPTISTAPSNQAVVLGQTATFTVTATGTAPLTYQWQKTGVNISGATAASYTTPPAIAADNGTVFSVTVTNSVGTVTSPNAGLSIFIPPTITTQPLSQTISAGSTVSFSVIASGTAPLSYQWQKDGVNLSGATSASYTTPVVVAGDNGALFSVVVTNGHGSVTSMNAVLTLRDC